MRFCPRRRCCTRTSPAGSRPGSAQGESGGGYDVFYDAAAVDQLKKDAAANGVSVEHIHLPNSDHGDDLVNDTEESWDAFHDPVLQDAHADPPKLVAHPACHPEA
jgi:hypothetical protein